MIDFGHEHFARELGLDQQRGDTYKGDCPFCGANSFWLTSRGWNCHACEESESSFARLRERIRAPRRWLTIEELEDQPPWLDLIEGLLPDGCFAVLYGESESGKSFLALDWCLRIAAPLDWMGRAVLPGGSIFIAAEGKRGLKKRVDAWSGRYRARPSSLRFQPWATSLLRDSDVDDVIAMASEMEPPPRLVVVDTLNQSMPGGDENSSKDMGLVIGSVRRIQAALGCTVLLIHHPGHNGGRPRGHSSLPRGADVIMSLERCEADLVLRCRKMKDEAHFEPIHLRLVPSAASLVIEAGGKPADRPELNTLLVLSEHPEGLTSGAWKAANTRGNSTHYRHQEKLLDAGLVAGSGERGEPYTITEAGWQALEASGLVGTTTGHGQSQSSLPPTLPPFRGEWDGSELEAGSEDDDGLETGTL